MLHGSPLHETDATAGSQTIGTRDPSHRNHLADHVHLPRRFPMQPVSTMDLHRTKMQGRCMSSLEPAA